LIFSIYINDIPKASKFETRLYADDITLKLSGKTCYELNENVNNELIKVENWLKSNKLSLNFTKTKYLVIKPFRKKIFELNNFNASVRGIKLEKWKQSLIIKPFRKKIFELNNFNVSVRGIKLEKCASAKYLGVILDENLNRKQHIHYLQLKLSQAVGIIAKMRKYLNGWGTASKTEQNNIQIL